MAKTRLCAANGTLYDRGRDIIKRQRMTHYLGRDSTVDNRAGGAGEGCTVRKALTFKIILLLRVLKLNAAMIILLQCQPKSCRPHSNGIVARVVEFRTATRRRLSCDSSSFTPSVIKV